MKILQISYAVNPTTSCYRLKNALEKEGHEVKIITMQATDKIADDQGMIVIRTFFLFRIYKNIYYRIRNLLIHLLYPNRVQSFYNLGVLGISYRRIKEYIHWADVVHIHWALGMINYSNLGKILRDNDKVVWTAHDCWPFTGGCHHDNGCDGYKKSCGKCPQLKSKSERDITKYVIYRKRKVFNDRIIMIGPSRWISERMRSSLLLNQNRVETIPNALDTDRFRLLDRDILRKKYGIKEYSKVIATGAADISSPYKGYRKFEAIMEMIGKDSYFANSVLLIFGYVQEIPENYGSIQVRKLGYIDDEDKMVEIYNMADVFLLTSTNENLPTTVMESMACGTPVVAFDIGGVGDMIEHAKDGYMAKAFDIGDYVNGIKWCIGNTELLSEKLHRKMEKYCSSSFIAKEHVHIFNECAGNRK